MKYQLLADAERAEIIEQIAASCPTPEQLVHDAERNHWRAVVEATVAGTRLPDFVAPDLTDAENKQAALEALRSEVK